MPFKVSDAAGIPNLRVLQFPASLPWTNRSSWMAVGFSLSPAPHFTEDIPHFFPPSWVSSFFFFFLHYHRSATAIFLFFLMFTLPQSQRLAGHVLMRWAGVRPLFQHWTLKHLQRERWREGDASADVFSVMSSTLFLSALPSPLLSVLALHHLPLESWEPWFMVCSWGRLIPLACNFCRLAWKFYQRSELFCSVHLTKTMIFMLGTWWSPSFLALSWLGIVLLSALPRDFLNEVIPTRQQRDWSGNSLS